MELRRLANFLGAYFHQDWALDAASADEVIEGFVRDDGPDRARELAAEIERLLATETSERALEESLRKMGCYYCFKSDGLSASEWLRRVRAKLR